MQLAWQPVAGASGYNVYRGTSPTTVNTLVSPSGGVATPGFTDSGAVNGTTYYYAVRSIVAGVESSSSSVVQATPVARSCSTGNAVVLENCFPGNATWNVHSTAQMPAGIEGYANNEGLAEASQTTAIASGTISKVSVYIDATSTASKVLVGIYTNANGHPGSLVSQGTLTFPSVAAWNDVTMSSASITSGTTYWIALLSPVGSGTVRFRDKTGLTGATKVEVSASTTLTALPNPWVSGSGYNDGPFSAFGAGS